jgi:hypothetical protein
MKINKPIATRDAALNLACELVRKVRDEGIDWFGASLRWFEQEDTLHAWRELMKGAAVQNPAAMHQTAQFARAGWALADQVLCELDVQYGHADKAKPMALQVYMTDRRLFGRPEQVKSMQSYSHFHRDLAIVVIIAEVCTRCGLKPTGSSERKSNGSAIVAQALQAEQVARIDVHAVRKIWSRWHKIAFPGGLGKLRPTMPAIACG